MPLVLVLHAPCSAPIPAPAAFGQEVGGKPQASSPQGCTQGPQEGFGLSRRGRGGRRQAGAAAGATVPPASSGLRGVTAGGCSPQRRELQGQWRHPRAQGIGAANPSPLQGFGSCGPHAAPCKSSAEQLSLLGTKRLCAEARPLLARRCAASRPHGGDPTGETPTQAAPPAAGLCRAWHPTGSDGAELNVSQTPPALGEPQNNQLRTPSFSRGCSRGCSGSLFCCARLFGGGFPLPAAAQEQGCSLQLLSALLSAFPRPPPSPPCPGQNQHDPKSPR